MQAMHGSASPKGEARRECAAKREARGREDYGWGWAGGVIEPTLTLVLPRTTRQAPTLLR